MRTLRKLQVNQLEIDDFVALTFDLLTSTFDEPIQ